jgi:hypothetical protein
MKWDSDNKFKGWPDEGKAFMVEMMKAIKDDVELGAHGKWEKLYKKICEAMNKSDQIDQGSSSSDDKIDFTVSCMPKCNQNMKYSSINQTLT